MPANQPRRQHLIPQMILKHFADAKGFLWVGHRDTGNVFRQRPQNAFVQNNLYTLYPYSDGESDTKYEERLSRIESDASPVVDRIIDGVRDRSVPDLSQPERLAVQRFVFSLVRRTPDSQKRISGNQDDKEVFFQAAMAQPDYMEKVGLDKDSLFRIEGVQALTKKMLHNVNADFAADDRTDLIRKEQQFCANTKLLFGLLELSEHQFVIGSHGITIIEAPTPSRSHSTRSETWVLPIAPDTIVIVASLAQQDSLQMLTSSNLVEHINQSTLHLSKQIAGPSQSVVSALVTA